MLEIPNARRKCSISTPINKVMPKIWYRYSLKVVKMSGKPCQNEYRTL